ncbi:MAG: VWA domain-containing protein [Piscinibacter sp.]|nr:VWA domain-containing protein [Piscinibacter sp.]
MRLDGRLWLAAAALALGATFLEPRLPLPRRLFEHVVVLDITQSMNVTDTLLDGRPVSRLAFAKQALRDALQELPCGSKLGLAIFTEYRSYLLFAPVEVCANRAELRSSLAAIDGTMAWSGNSEVAKGLHSARLIVQALPGVPSLVFVTDGHEAPPLNPRHRPAFDDKAGEVPGVLVGVGDTRPSPIPKFDPVGRPLGLWAADEVLQTDPRSLGRGGSVGGEAMVEQDAAPPAVGLGATPGAEHLSGLREPYLKLLAAEGGFAYHRLRGEQGLREVLLDPALARPVTVRADLRPLLAGLALLLLLAPYLAAGARRLGWRWSHRARPGGGHAGSRA